MSASSASDAYGGDQTPVAVALPVLQLSTVQASPHDGLTAKVRALYCRTTVCTVERVLTFLHRGYDHLAIVNGHRGQALALMGLPTHPKGPRP